MAGSKNAALLRSKHSLNERTGKLERRSAIKPSYRVIAVGLYADQAKSLDHAAQLLQEAGLDQANRSFVVQALVRRLQHDIEGMGAHEILSLFVEKYLRRPLAHARPREPVTARLASDEPSVSFTRRPVPKKRARERPA